MKSGFPSHQCHIKTSQNGKSETNTRYESPCKILNKIPATRIHQPLKRLTRHKGGIHARDARAVWCEKIVTRHSAGENQTHGHLSWRRKGISKRQRPFVTETLRKPGMGEESSTPKRTFMKRPRHQAPWGKNESKFHPRFHVTPENLSAFPALEAPARATGRRKGIWDHFYLQVTGSYP